MTAIPEKTVPTPEQLQGELSSWYILHKQLGELKQLEMLKRKFIAPLFFPDPKPGTNRRDVGFGFDLVFVNKLNYNVDDAALDASAASLRKAGIKIDEVFEYKPRLVTSKYNTLNDKQKELLAQVVTISPGAPDLKIVPVGDPSPEEIGLQPVVNIAIPTVPTPEAPAIAAEPVPEPTYIMSPLAGDFTEEDFIGQGWTREQLIDAGYLIAQEPEGPIVPPAPRKTRGGRPKGSKNKK